MQRALNTSAFIIKLKALKKTLGLIQTLNSARIGRDERMIHLVNVCVATEPQSDQQNAKKKTADFFFQQERAHTCV